MEFTLALLDYIMLIVDVAGISSMIFYGYYYSLAFSRCKSIEIKMENLVIWRYGLYAAISGASLASYFTFVYASPVRVFFHLIFMSGTMITLFISLPAWICEQRGIIDYCNCKSYNYIDFIPMLIIGSLFTISFIFVHSAVVLVVAAFVYILSYFFSPKKKVMPLNIPPDLELRTIDDFQMFLMYEPHHRKIISILHAGCDFCDIQIAEFEKLNEQYKSHSKILDISPDKDVDPFIINFLGLNGDNLSEELSPSAYIFDNGMSFDRKDGLLSHAEILMIMEKLI